MGHGGDSPTSTAERSSPPKPNFSGKRQRYYDTQRGEKRQRFVSTERETRARVHTRKPEFDATFSAYTRGHTSSYARSRDWSYTNSCSGWAPRHTSSYSRSRDWSYTKPCSGWAPPRRRKWTFSDRDLSDCIDRVVIVSYNILGEENAKNHPELYRGVSPNYLDWEYRKKVLCDEVKGYQASILCFQEVDHFDDLNEILGKDGFRGLYKARTDETPDGCAIFWKDKLFTLLHEENIEFQKFGLRNNIAQFCVLKMNEDVAGVDATSRSPSETSSRSLLVGNTHVLYNPKRGDIKLGQMRIYLEKAYQLSQEWGQIPVVITGDLNSLPQSALYQFVASSKLDIQQHDRRHISGQLRTSEYSNFRIGDNHIPRWTDEEMMLATGSTASYSLRHDLKLCSAYAEVPGNFEVRDKTAEPLATSYHSLFTGTVDYIWHTLNLAPVKVLETLSMHSLRQTGGLPSKDWASDHLAVVCELAFVAEADKDRPTEECNLSI